MIQMETALRQLIAEIVDERIGSAAARGDAMARMYGEYVNIGKAGMRLGVKEKHNGSQCAYLNHGEPSFPLPISGV